MENTPSLKYTVEWQSNDRHLLRVGNPRLYQHPYQSLQLPLWPPGEVEWHVIIRLDSRTHKRKQRGRIFVIQFPLPIELTETS
jgi:hypothetical protein